MYPARLLLPFIQGATPNDQPRAAEGSVPYGVRSLHKRAHLYAAQRHTGAVFGPGAGSSGAFGPVGRRICRISNVDFGEFPFYVVG